MSNTLDDTLKRIVQEESARRNPQLAKQHSSLGEKALDAERYEEARGHFQIALNWDANDKYYFGLGKSYLDLESLDEAVESFGEAIRLNPGNDKAHFRLGWALKEKGDTSKAINEYKTSIRLNPNHALVHFWLGLALGKKGDLESAIEELTKAVDLDNSDPYYHSGLAMFLTKAGKYAQALEGFRESIRLGNESGANYLGIGLILENNGELQEAKKQYERAIKVEPGCKDAREALDSLTEKLPEYKYQIAIEQLRVLGRDYHNTEKKYQAKRVKWDQGLDSLITITRTNPDFLPAYQMIVAIHIAMSRLDEARGNIEIVEELASRRREIVSLKVNEYLWGGYYNVRVIRATSPTYQLINGNRRFVVEHYTRAQQLDSQDNYRPQNKKIEELKSSVVDSGQILLELLSVFTGPLILGAGKKLFGENILRKPCFDQFVINLLYD